MKIKSNTGFTLIEIMVAVSIFSLVMMVAIGAVLAIVSANKKAQALSSVMTNLNFALESMVRDLRTGNTYECGDGPAETPTPTDCAGGGDIFITFYSSQYANEDGSSSVVSYGHEGGGITKYTNIDGEERSYPLTAAEVEIESLRFYVQGTDDEDELQPRILVVIKGHTGGVGQVQTDFSIQTTVLQRKLDIPST